MIDIKLRWNTRCTDNYFYWRLIIDGHEHLCSSVKIYVPVTTTCDIVFDSLRNENVEKHHVSCKANSVEFDGDVAIIR